jgi:hypothetical protein
MRSLILIFLSVLFLSSTALCGKYGAPFGLSWGMTKQEVKALGVKLSPMGSETRLKMCSTASLPKNIPIADLYTLVFDDKYGLQRVIMGSKIIKNDLYGTKGKREFDKLKQALTNKYGEPSEFNEIIGLQLWDKPDEFYQCLQYDGCGIWIAIFTDSEHKGGIVLELNGLRRGVGFVSLSYEGNKIDLISQEQNDINMQKNENAL